MKINIKLYIFFLISVSPFIHGLDRHILSDSLNTDLFIVSDSLDVQQADSTVAFDSSAAIIPTESLLPIEQITSLRNYEYGTKLNEKHFRTEDYKTSSDLFNYLPYGFMQDLGQLGQPNEQMFYGLGFGNIGYNRDGVRLNNTWQNSYDLNKLPFERTDSLEIVPLPRGFLFDAYNNPVTVNFYTRDNFSLRPVTRLKFYQSSFDEGFINLLFHTYATKRFDFGVGLSVSGIDSRFYNSDYESWKLNGKLGYMFNNNLFIRANYYFVNDSLALNGGLPTSTIENGYYSNVLYENRYQLSTNHYGELKVLASIFPNSKTDLTLYYQYDKQKFRQNEDTLVQNIPVLVNNNSFQTAGASFRNDYLNDYFNLYLSANYEITKYSLEMMNTNETDNILSIAGQLQLTPIESLIVPTAYAKYSRLFDNNFFGFGADLNVSLNDQLTLYGGLSFYSKPHSRIERYYSDSSNLPPDYSQQNSPAKSDITTLEIGANFNLDFLYGSASYFTYSNSNAFKPIIDNYSDSLLINEVSILESYSQSISGLNINFNLKVWRFLFSNNITYFFSNADNFTSRPDYSIAGKIYYIDKVFNGNLKLKTGINYRFTGEQPYFVYDFEKSMQARFVTSAATGTQLIQDEVVPTSFQIDLYLAGTIQELATIYVVLENVIDSEYYIVPYYYKQPQMLRLGVSWILFD